MKQQPITPELILAELREVTFLTQLTFLPTERQFAKLLENPEFVEAAAMAINAKLDAISEGRIVFETASARSRTRQGWAQLLKRIEPSLWQGASESIGR